jgi:uncharacterized protein (DUF1778 family)
MRQRRVEALSETTHTRLSREEKARLCQAAAAHLQRPSDFIRDAILEAASDILEQDEGAAPLSEE